MRNKPAEPRIDPREYRKPMVITNWGESYIVNHKGLQEVTYYPKCPRCNTPMDRDYVRFCSYCGQRLKWSIPVKKKPRL